MLQVSHSLKIWILSLRMNEKDVIEGVFPALFVFQALRYPYFHVGQALGARLKYSEQHKVQAKVSEAAAETKPLSLCKTNLEFSEPSKTQAELQTCSQFLHQPLQQISLPQYNMEPSTKQAMCFSTLPEGQQEPLSLVKNRQPMSQQAVGITQVQLLNVRTGCSWALQNFLSTLYVHFKAYKSSAHRSREQHHWNEVGTSAVGPDVFQVRGQLGRRRGRRRWSFHFQKTHNQLSQGLCTGGVRLSVRPLHFLVKRCVFITILKKYNNKFLSRFPESKNNTTAKLSSNRGLNRADSSTLSAKQHYLRQSRYLPGDKNWSRCHESHISMS